MGTQTGAGIAGDPAVLDVTQPGATAPTRSTWTLSGPKRSADAAGGLRSGNMAAIRECGGAGAVYSVVDPQTGAPARLRHLDLTSRPARQAANALYQ